MQGATFSLLLIPRSEGMNKPREAKSTGELKQLTFDQGMWLVPCLLLTILQMLFLAVHAQVVGTNQILKDFK